MSRFDAYLERIRYAGPREPTLETLRSLHEHHLLSVPFENLDIHLGEPIRCDLDRFFQKIVFRNRGGFCYELNGLFAALLRHLGFDVTMLSARVRTADGGFGAEFDHMALLILLQGQRWLADVGYGDSFRRPLSLDTIEVQQDPAGLFCVETSDEGWLVTRDGAPEYRFTLESRRLEDYEGMCHYHQTSGDSPFTKKRVCSMATLNGRITVSGMKLIVTENGSRQERELEDQEAWHDALRDHFGVNLRPEQPASS